MAASTNALTLTLRQQDSSSVDIISPSGAGRTIGPISYAGAAGQFTEALSIPTSATTITLPKATILQLFIKNLDATNFVTVTWTPQGGASNVALKLGPGDVLAFWHSASSGTYRGITALSLQADTAAITVEMFLGG